MCARFDLRRSERNLNYLSLNQDSGGVSPVKISLHNNSMEPRIFPQMGVLGNSQPMERADTAINSRLSICFIKKFKR